MYVKEDGRSFDVIQAIEIGNQRMNGVWNYNKSCLLIGFEDG